MFSFNQNVIIKIDTYIKFGFKFRLFYVLSKYMKNVRQKWNAQISASYFIRDICKNKLDI